MSTEEPRKEAEPETPDKSEERELSVEDIESEKAEDVKGGGIQWTLSGAAGQRPGGGGDPEMG
ncbi:MAG: hypothetical protein H6742_09515 [Alphaproteobacteria bacterium]|nr:hypothetical protein [Alphaproteobacteria bacterium]